MQSEASTNQVELKVNVVNQLLLYRNSTFKDRLSFVDENTQNAQRAKASELYITCDSTNKIVRFKDNGVGLEDPQALFSMSESGWDADVMENENPFGLGFFSNISLSNLIEIKSKKFHIIFDVDKVINTRDTHAIVVNELEEEFEGFELTLNNFDFSIASTYRIEERAIQLGKYVQELEVYYNNIKCPKADITVGDGDKDNFAIDDGEIKGWFRFTNCWEYKLGVFYKGRHIKFLDEFPGVLGDLHIGDRTLTLTAPDRKDIISDDKYSNFKSLIQMYIQEVVLKIVQSREQKYVDRISDSLKHYAKGDIFFQSLKFLVVDKKEDFGFVGDLIKIKKERSYLSTFSELEGYLKKEDAKPKEANEGFVESLFPADTKINATSGRFDILNGTAGHYYSGGGSGGYIAGKPAMPIEKVLEDDEYTYKLGTDLLRAKRATFWVDVSELPSYEEQVSIAEHYNLTLVVCRNKIESQLWRSQQDSGLAYHLGDLENQVVIETEVFNTDLNLKEQRAAMIFAMISRMAGYSENIFVIGDVVAKRVLEVEELGIRDELRIPDVSFVANKLSNKVYIDRRIVKLSKLRSDLSPIIALNDYKFVLTHVNDICDALGTLMKRNADELQRDLIRALAENPYFG